MLERLRAKPHHVKQSISLLITVIIFLCILFVWVSSRDARSQEVQVRQKTVSPSASVSDMFSGFISGLKERVDSSQFSAQSNLATSTATSTDNFDLSEVVIIDHTATSTKGATPSPAKVK